MNLFCACVIGGEGNAFKACVRVYLTRTKVDSKKIDTKLSIV